MTPADSCAGAEAERSPLAEALVDTIRDLSAARQECDSLRELWHAQFDYLHWLQREVCRARQWTTLDAIRAWHEELDRRQHQRGEMRADCERAA